MSVLHKNKAFATLLAVVLGTLGAHRLYLSGPRDRALWLHAASLPLAVAALLLWPKANWFYQILPLLVSGIGGCIEALVIGLMHDDKFDARYNLASGRQSDSSWVLALLLVATLMAGAVLVIATLSRLFDLLYTGGAYG
jgi:TM2 domain-containing membrane protein YozV